MQPARASARSGSNSARRASLRQALAGHRLPSRWPRSAFLNPRAPPDELAGTPRSPGRSRPDRTRATRRRAARRRGCNRTGRSRPSAGRRRPSPDRRAGTPARWLPSSAITRQLPRMHTRNWWQALCACWPRTSRPGTPCTTKNRFTSKGRNASTSPATSLPRRSSTAASRSTKTPRTRLFPALSRFGVDRWLRGAGAGIAIAHDARRVAGHDRIRRHRFDDDRAGGDHRAAADRDPRPQRRVRPDRCFRLHDRVRGICPAGACCAGTDRS